MNNSVLIVEDDETSFVIAKKLFEAIGCTVEHTVSGEEAIKLFIDHQRGSDPYIMIYMNLGLSGIDGIQTVAMMRDYENRANLLAVRIIGVTTETVDHDLIKKCTDSGMQDVLAKPLTTDNLVAFLGVRSKHGR